MTDRDQPLWIPSPDRIAATHMREFADRAGAAHGLAFETYGDLHRWSVDQPEAFWLALWDYAGVVGDMGDTVLENANAMPGAAFFPDARISFAENLLRGTGTKEAVVFRGEDKARDRLTFGELRAMVSKLQQAMARAGVKQGDRIAAMVPNRPETIALMLAANSLGAIWSSCSPDFGKQGVLDRFGQIEPVMFIGCDGYWYNGKAIDVGEKLAGIAEKLTAEKVVVMDYLGNAASVAEKTPGCVTLDDFMADFTARDVTFERLPFDHPLYILFSSGTTGIPKCIVHGQGGTLLQHLKEHILHCDLGAEDRIFYFTTCGWMMWNWLVSGLATGGTVMLFDGSPFAPDADVLFDYAEQEGITFFGTSAKFIDALRNAGRRPMDSHDLSRMKTIASTGSPLAPENFRYVYDAISKDVHLASVSGGTDIVACFVGAIPWQPVHVGEIQGPCLAMASDVWDDDGKPMASGKGELVCTRPFPSLPIGFWNDPDGEKYHDAYFSRFGNVWCHGDFAEWTDHGGMIIHGRSDATLNPGGVRIGTAEIYNQVEQMAEIEEALCIGQQWQSDTRVVLFVRLAEGVSLNDDLQGKVRARIRSGASPRHVPAVIVAVDDIPRTKSGKITELAVRDVVHGIPVRNKEAMANPEALAQFENLPELQA